MGSVNITLANGGLGGTLQTADGVVGFVMTGTADDDYVLGTPILITGLAGLAAADITEANNPFAYNQVKDFYKTAGDGASLYLMLVADTELMSDMADNTNANGAKKLLDYADGAIKVLGITTDDDTVLVSEGEGLNEEVGTAIPNMEVMALAYFNQQKPFRAIIGGSSYAGTPGDLTDLRTLTANRTGVFIGSTASGANVSLGLLMGAIAAQPVQTKISRVRNGALPITSAYVGETAISGVAGSDESLIAAKGYITFTTYPHRAGYFFSGDPMATATTDDYTMLARGRVIDKAHILAYTTFVSEIDEEVPVNEDGTLDAGFCKHLSQQMENTVNNTMTANREISSVRVFIDPAQNILSTNTLAVSISIIPVGYATNINITLGFTNPAAA